MDPGITMRRSNGPDASRSTDPLEIVAPAGPAEDDIPADQAGHVPERRYYVGEPEKIDQGH